MGRQAQQWRAFDPGTPVGWSPRSARWWCRRKNEEGGIAPAGAGADFSWRAGCFILERSGNDGTKPQGGTMQAKVRKYLLVVETTEREMGRELAKPSRKAVALAVIANPFSGRYADDLEELMQIGEELGGVLGEKAVAALGVPLRRSRATARRRSSARRASSSTLRRSSIRASASRSGRRSRRAALVPSAKKMGGIGASIDVPLGHKDAAFVRSHFDAIEVRVPDAPRADEIVVAVAVTDSGRPLPRIGGLSVDQIEGKDGLR